jgi:hypothetical protein
MIYIKLDDKIGKTKVFLEGGHYTISDLIDIISFYADADEESEEDRSDDEFYRRVFGTLLND